MNSTNVLYDRVWINGCFDILHPGHIRILEYAKSFGKFLMVGIDSDTTVRESKGPGRPYFNAIERMEMLKAIRYVDQVVIFEGQLGLKREISKFNPDCIVDGAEYMGYVVLPDDYTGPVMYYPRIEKYSTTNIIENVNK